MSEKIMVSICATVYNHARYLRKALNSIVGQRTDFKYEVIIGEDCSSDDSRSILKEYEMKYPELFVMIYQPFNKGVAENSRDVFDRAQGKYVLAMDMDDFFTDKNKLQTEFDFLEENPEAVAVYHKTVIVDAMNKKRRNVIYPQSREGVFHITDLAKWKSPGQVATAMYRNYHKKNDWMDGVKVQRLLEYGPGDMAKAFVLSSYGKVYIKDWSMSAYRYVNDSGSGFSASNGLTYESYRQYFERWKDYATESARNPEAYKTAESLWFEALVACCFIEKHISLKKLIKETVMLKYPFFCICCLIRHICSKVYKRIVFRLNGTIRI